MPSKSAGRKGRRSGGKDRNVSGPAGCVSWEEHEDRVKAAVSVATALFLQANGHNIQKASGEVAARNSYLSGMIDMLTVARHAVGFWGADQILLELERLNQKRAPDEAGTGAPAAQPAGRGHAVPEGCSVGGAGVASPAEAVGNGPAKGVRRDPMFA